MSSQSQHDKTPRSHASGASRRGLSRLGLSRLGKKTSAPSQSEVSIAEPSSSSESSLSELSHSENSLLKPLKVGQPLSEQSPSGQSQLGSPLSGQSQSGSPLSGPSPPEPLPPGQSLSEPTPSVLLPSEGPSSALSLSELTLDQSSSLVPLSETQSVVEFWTLIRSKTSLSETLEERIALNADGAVTLGQYAAECQKLGGNVGEIAWHLIDYANRKQLWTYLGVGKPEYLEMLGVGGHLGDLAESYQQTKKRQKRWGGQIAEKWGSEWREFMSPLADGVGETILNAWLKLSKTEISKDVARNMVQEEREKRRESTRRGRKGPEASLADLQNVLKTVKGLDVSNIPMQIEDLGDLTMNMDLDTYADEVSI